MKRLLILALLLCSVASAQNNMVRLQVQVYDSAAGTWVRRTLQIGSGFTLSAADSAIKPDTLSIPPGAGTGDMTKSVYDTDGNGVVDSAEAAPGGGVGSSFSWSVSGSAAASDSIRFHQAFGGTWTRTGNYVTYIPDTSTVNIGLATLGDMARLVPDSSKRSGTTAIADSSAKAPVRAFTPSTTQSLVAADTITVTDGLTVKQISSAGNITITSQPTIAAGRNGQWVYLRNVGNFTITLQDINVLAGSLLRLTSNTVGIGAGGTLALCYDGTGATWMQSAPVASVLSFTPSISEFTVDGSAAGTREVAGSGTEAAPAFALTYVGAPSAASVNHDTIGTGYPYSLSAPYTSGTGGTYQKRRVVNALTTFTATATVSGTAGLTHTATIRYYNRRYIGPDTSAASLTTAEILGLDGTGGASELSNSVALSATTVTIGSGKYLWYAYRSALGTDSLYLRIGGEAAGIARVGLVSHTNDQSFVENFQTLRSTNSNLGTSISAVVAASFSTSSNRLWMGPNSQTTILNSAQTIALDDAASGTSKLASAYTGSYTVTAATGEYIWFAYPSRITGTPVFTVGGFEGGFTSQGTATITNDYGFTETYQFYRSNNSGLGLTVVVVS
jgi:hypothetical protein